MLVLKRTACDQEIPERQVVLVIPPSTKERTVLVDLHSVYGKTARIGFTADKDINIRRGEVENNGGRHAE